MELTAIIEKGENGRYVGQIEEYPGVISQGVTIPELKENLLDAFNLLTETNNETPRLNVHIKERLVEPGNVSVVDDLKEAMEEIKRAKAGEIKLQNAWDLINEL